MCRNVDELCGRGRGTTDQGEKGVGRRELWKGVATGENRGVVVLLCADANAWLICPLQMPTILADNGGHDSSDLVARLRAAHYEGQSDAGLGRSQEPLYKSMTGADSVRTDMDKGEIASMRKLGVTESYKLKKQVVVSASEAAEMILR
jgi:hypothetical protein